MTSENQAALEEQIRWSEAGLVPAVVQDALSKEVLMLAYMNRESLRRSVETGETWFWSRSREQLWHKGETSGHTQRIVSMHYDCDGDTLLVRVAQQGPACHTGKYSCFFNPVELKGEAAANDSAVQSQTDRFAVLSKLEATIAERDAERPEGAYTTYLFQKGLDKILKKVGEESAEVIIAAKNRDNDELRCEAGDLIYHLMVLLRERKLPLDDVLQELERRHYRTDQPNKTE
ncbi:MULTISPECIES: bifunctional phosphoribosyl-AMP cyclohydrolase/phosphoribosyl-ATP diphosphatase HisIE [unclassified Paenibacillus]|uniref:bifunctional phosphoribosyl-AMP cyclohydrolase/phosphoribosyl-ATP diphosphatase HisIE n=1 Tax=unclassified Paenibacillus TaxID=185978 RepID=UPI001C0F3CE1|nr:MULTISPECIES: bifunctional phosphoribosyl-AMP cyclohydrolase/phosphoribosyl-ATP diphosphatase HisIE [unclassified Paenibacillus]MBU5445280.1 bifunctional phosphoribosyl-AMP cyclohydrolase/phosphoribosyl-ATP diphosphatase HisIE [Paenibacillus sp. MSJ-34]CAH0122053.1 Histidine biosynthesis bifunctional protein HisIE [Paenibacillus sp. CECT 9249]